MKRARTRNSQESIPPASIEEVAASVQRIRSMSPAEKEALCDVIFKKQPTLLGHVLVLSKLKVPMEKIDRVLHVLLVLYDLFTRTTPGGLLQVSEDLLEQVDANQWAMLKLMDSEEPAEASRLCQLSLTTHPEINALAFATGELVEAGMAKTMGKDDELCVRATRNLVDAFAHARRADAAERMAVQHTSRTGKIYYLHVKTTAARKPSYFFSTDANGSLADLVPDGYEIYENVNGQVFLRKKPVQIIQPVELALVEADLGRREDALRYWVEAKKGAIVVYQAGETDSLDGMLAAFGRGRLSNAAKRRFASYIAMLRFTLVDKKTRAFVTERFCFRGSVDDWIHIGGPGVLTAQIHQFTKHLGRESFYELI